MNDSLTVYLGLLGAAVVLLVLVHGWWQSRSASVRQVKRLPIEPVDSTLGGGVEAVAGPLGAAVPNPHQVPPVRKGHARLDPLIDAIATITIDAPVSGDHVLLHVPASRRHV